MLKVFFYGILMPSIVIALLSLVCSLIFDDFSKASVLVIWIVGYIGGLVLAFMINEALSCEDSDTSEDNSKDDLDEYSLSPRYNKGWEPY